MHDTEPDSLCASSSRPWLRTPPLRFRRFWLLAGVLVIALVIVLGVFRPPAPLRWLMPDDKLAHALLYASVTWAFAQVLLDAHARLLAVASLLMLGVAIECLQAMMSTRQFELLDLAANAVGALCAWRLTARCNGSLLPRLESFYLRLAVRPANGSVTTLPGASTLPSAAWTESR